MRPSPTLALPRLLSTLRAWHGAGTVALAGHIDQGFCVLCKSLKVSLQQRKELVASDYNYMLGASFVFDMKSRLLPKVLKGVAFEQQLYCRLIVDIASALGRSFSTAIVSTTTIGV